MQFGQSDIQLGSPTFVAQTNVDRGVNTFEELQKILGMSAQVLTQAVELDTQEIRQEISYKAALEQEAERQSRQKAIKASEKFADIALRREQYVAAGDYEGVEALYSEVLQTPYATPQERIEAASAAQAINVDRKALRAEREEKALDPLRVELAGYARSTSTAVAARNIDSLKAVQNTILDRLEVLDPDKDKDAVSALSDRLSNVNQQIYSLEQRKEADDRQLEQAAASALTDLMTPQVVDAQQQIVADKTFLASVATASADTLGTAAFEALRDRFIAQSPEYTEIITNGSDAEKKAVNTVLLRASSEIVSKITDERNRIDREQAVSRFVDSTKQNAIFNGFSAAVETVSNERDFSDSDKNDALIGASKAVIESASSPVDQMRAAAEIANNPDVSPAVRNYANGNLIAIGTKTLGSIADKRPARFDPLNDNSIGWVREYDTYEEFLGYISGELGIDAGTVLSNPQAYPVIGDAVVSLSNSYSRDETASIKHREQQRLRDLASDRNARRNLDPDTVFDSTPLGTMLDDRDSIGNLSAEQAYMLIRGDATGYRDGRTPSRLVKKLTESWADPAYAELNRQFWKLNTVSTNPVLMQSTDRGKHQQAMMAGIIYDHIISMPNMTDQAAQGMYTQAASILKAVQEPTLNLNSTDPGVIEATKSVAKAVDGIMTSGGIAVDGTWLSIDDVNYSGSELMDQMNPADQGTFLTFYLSAQALSKAVPGLDPSSTTVQMMRSNGWVPYVNKDQGTASIVFSPPIQDPSSGQFYQTVPSHEEMASSQFMDYMNGKKTYAVNWMNSQPMDVPKTYTEADIASIEPYINDLDAARGRLGAVVKTKAGNTFFIPSSAVGIGGMNWKNYLGRETPTRQRVQGSSRSRERIQGSGSR
jgi:hypothetical protein